MPSILPLGCDQPARRKRLGGQGRRRIVQPRAENRQRRTQMRGERPVAPRIERRRDDRRPIGARRGDGDQLREIVALWRRARVPVERIGDHALTLGDVLHVAHAQHRLAEPQVDALRGDLCIRLVETADELDHGLAHCCPRSSAVGEVSLDHLAELFEHRGEVVEHDLLLGPEVAVEGPWRAARGGGDHFDACGVETVAREERKGGARDLGAGVLLATFHERVGHHRRSTVSRVTDCLQD
jgi:hypothetical protein